MAHVSGLKRGSLRVAAAVLVVAAAFGTAGCGKKRESQAVVGQVIAHVGPDDFTQQELDNELRLANVPVDKRTVAVVKAALSRIIERKYLVQQAVARGARPRADGASRSVAVARDPCLRPPMFSAT